MNRISKYRQLTYKAELLWELYSMEDDVDLERIYLSEMITSYDQMQNLVHEMSDEEVLCIAINDIERGTH